MAQATKCLTSDAIFHTAINERDVSVKVELPFKLDISDEEASILERLLHNQIEVVLRYHRCYSSNTINKSLERSND